MAEAGEEAAVRTMEGGEEEEQGPFAANGSKPNPEDEDELEEARKVVGEDGVSYETLEDRRPEQDPGGVPDGRRLA